jgi:hypothetical protein
MKIIKKRHKKIQVKKEESDEKEVEEGKKEEEEGKKEDFINYEKIIEQDEEDYGIKVHFIIIVVSRAYRLLLQKLHN